MDDLIKKESALRSKMEGATGLIEEKAAWLNEHGIFEAYSDIHQAYASRLSDTGEGLEALKQALFIQWFGVTEPPFLSGINELNPVSTNLVLEFLDEILRQQNADAELTMMLKWYVKTTDWYFKKLYEFPHILQVAKQADGSFIPEYKFTQFDGRGEMGEYWQSLNFAEPAI